MTSDLWDAIPVTRLHWLARHHLKQRTCRIKVVDRLTQVLVRLPLLQRSRQLPTPATPSHTCTYFQSSLWEGFVERVGFESRVEKNMSNASRPRVTDGKQNLFHYLLLPSRVLTCVNITEYVIAIGCPSVRPSLCPSHTGIMSKRLNLSSNFLHCLV